MAPLASRDDDSDGVSSSSSRGRDAGIVLGCVAATGLVIYLVATLWRSFKKSRQQRDMPRAPRNIDHLSHLNPAQFIRLCNLRAERMKAKNGHLLSMQEVNAVTRLTPRHKRETSVGKDKEVKTKTIAVPAPVLLAGDSKTGDSGTRISVDSVPSQTEDRDAKTRTRHITFEEPSRLSHSLTRSSTASTTVCCVCLEDYQDAELVRVTPCSHIFHSKCLEGWLTNYQSRCPLCQRSLKPEDNKS